VVVAFELADINRPIVLGALYNIQDPPPLKKGDEHNNIKKLELKVAMKLYLMTLQGRKDLNFILKMGQAIK
jgi:hypothetical protein